jgi:hypothetical protein
MVPYCAAAVAGAAGARRGGRLSRARWTPGRDIAAAPNTSTGSSLPLASAGRKRCRHRPLDLLAGSIPEPDLSLVEAGRAWSFDADGEDLKLAAEAYRIQLAHLFDPMMVLEGDQRIAEGGLSARRCGRGGWRRGAAAACPDQGPSPRGRQARGGP